MGLMSNSIFKAKELSSWKKEDETQGSLDPLARVSSDFKTEKFKFNGKSLHPDASISPSNPHIRSTHRVPLR
jgi:hypothetical protein